MIPTLHLLVLMELPATYDQLMTRLEKHPKLIMQ